MSFLHAIKKSRWTSPPFGPISSITSASTRRRRDNPVRRHSTLGYLSPIDFEGQASVAKPRAHQIGSGSVEACFALERFCP